MSSDDKSPVLFWICIGMFLVSALVFGIRVGWRWFKSQYGVDDIMLCCAFATLVVQTAFALEAGHWGFGKHFATLDAQQKHNAMMFFFFVQVTFKILAMFVQLAFLMLYLRVFELPKFQVFTKIMIANTIAGSICFMMLTIFQCTPVDSSWNGTKGKCLNKQAVWYPFSVWHALTDFVIFAMPIPVIKSLQMPGSRKLGLASVFFLGAFTCAASIVRMTTLAASSKTNDPTWGSFEATYWSIIENNTSLICACLPALRAPAVQLYRRITGRSMGGSTGRLQYMDDIKLSGGRSQQYGQRSNLDGGDWDVGTDRRWYDTKFHATQRTKEEQDDPNSSQEQILGIMKTTNVEVNRAHDTPTEASSNDAFRRY